MNTNMDKPKQPNKAYRTHAIFTPKKKTKVTHITIPTEEGVIRAREFVDDENKQ